MYPEYKVGDKVLTPRMGEGLVLARHDDFYWVLLDMVDQTMIPSTYKAHHLEKVFSGVVATSSG